MKRIILIIFVGLFLSGCSVNYNVHFFEETIFENVDVVIEEDIYETANLITGDGYYYQKELVDSNIPSIKDYSDYYKKKINVYNNKSYVNLNYIYNYDNFGNSYLLNRCFENVNIINDKKYLYVSLSGNFQCFDFEYDEININLSSEYKIANHNAHKVENNKYIWKININDDPNISFQLIKEPEIKKINFLDVLKIILSIVLIVSGIIIYLFKKNLDK